MAYSRDQVERLVAGQSSRPVAYGVPGMADLGGIAAPNGVRIEVECKAGSGTQSDAQRNWQRMIELHGGVYILARSPEQAESDLRVELDRRRAA